MSQGAFAASLKAVGEKISSELQSISYVVGAIGILFAGIYFMIGHQNASARMTQAMFGLLCVSIVAPLVLFMKGLA